MTAIVTDAHYRMSVSLIRDLFDRGVRVAACEKASIEAPVGFASRGTAQCIRLPDEEYEAALLALCREMLEIEGEKPVLLPVGAKTLAMVSRSRDAFSAVAGLCAATPSQLALFNDKAAVSALAKTLGVPVPESFERQPEEADEPFFSRVPLPCAVKPHCGENFGLTASQRYRICRTKNELIAAFRHFQTLTNEDPIVQEYLPGAAYGCSVLAKDGAVYRSLCHRRVREYPVSGGPSSCCESVSRSDLLAFSEALVQETGFTGPAMFEFKCAADGKPASSGGQPPRLGHVPAHARGKDRFCLQLVLPCRRASFAGGGPGAARENGVLSGGFCRRSRLPQSGSARKVFCRGGGFSESPRQKRHRGPQRPRARAGLFPQSFSPGRTQMKLLADLHVHSRASLDGRSSVEALIETARTRGLSAITVSDHDLCTPLPDCKDLFLIPGVEITSANGHILGLFLDAPIDFAALGKFPPPAQAIAAIHASGGLAVLAHPFAPQKLAPEEIARLGFDAIETANARAMLKPGANEKARQLSQKLSLPGTGGSDAHCAKELGGCVTEFSCEPSPDALKEALKAGSCRAVEVRACKWVWKGLSKIRREQSCGTVLSRCKALCYFAACIARDVFHV